MQKASGNRGFTLIELLTVIAIIAVLAAILFPVAGTVREQARAAGCMSNLHQLWVSANVYRLDEGAFPPTLMGYAENPDGSYNTTGTGVVPANRIINGFLYGEQVKDVGVFKCADNTNPNQQLVTVAHFPPRPSQWPTGASYVGDSGVSGCPSDSYGVIDCFREPEVDSSSALYHQPKFFYIYNSYDIGPRLDPTTGRAIAGVYDVHYSPDWTGVTGSTDLPVQLKYQNPPPDKTLLAFCSWHTATYGADTVTSISMAGKTSKVPLNRLVVSGANLYNR